MYGLEKEDQRHKKFVFDLEKEIRENPSRGKKIQENVEEQITALKKQLREGAKEKESDQLGVLLHGYTSLQRVLRKVK